MKSIFWFIPFLLIPSALLAWSQLGSAISFADGLYAPKISGNGNVLAAKNLDALLIYELKNSDWVKRGDTITLSSGGELVISENGDTVAIQDSNGIRVFKWESGSWVISGNIQGITGVSSLAISNDGLVIAAGFSQNNDNGYYTGEVIVYAFNGVNWVQRGNDINGPWAHRLGMSVSLNNNGSVLAAGGHGTYQTGYVNGYVRVYDWNGYTWNERSSTISGTYEEQMGCSVSLNQSGNTIAVGSNAYAVGGGYKRLKMGVYTYNNGVWAKKGNDIDGVNFAHDQYVDINSAGDIASARRTSQKITVYQFSGSWQVAGDFSGSSATLNGDGDIIALAYNSEIITYASSALSLPEVSINTFYEAPAGGSITVDSTPISGFPRDFTYQWYFNDLPIPSIFGGNSSTYAISGYSAYDGNYEVEVTNSYGTSSDSFVFATMVDNDLDGISDGKESYITLTNPNNPDSDGDQINDGDEINIYNTDPNDTDTDDDGFDDYTENIRGMNPTNPDTWIKQYILSNPSNFSLYDLDSVQDLRPGSTMIEVQNGQATLSMEVEQSDDLEIWTSGGTTNLQIPIDPNSDTKFFRFKMAE